MSNRFEVVTNGERAAVLDHKLQSAYPFYDLGTANEALQFFPGGGYLPKRGLYELLAGKLV